ncbi:adhesin transport system outer membrane protein [Cupriavidus agavae]|uniref:Adhesin transport system outer membrane protein n=1 Tax=Cupriavidus agavae TaxID=1001822 RepID=A0A4Q7S250_9BURK|nr:adhesin transport system outer membrane protein [Cupriavidus agavae]
MAGTVREFSLLVLALGALAGMPALAAPPMLTQVTGPAPLPRPALADAPADPAGVRHVAVQGLNMREAVGIAISRHPDISRANAVIAQSTSEVAVAQAAWYPRLEYGVRPGYGGTFGTGGNSAGARASVGVSQLVYDFGRTSSRIAAADATLNRNRHLLADSIETVAANTAATFVDLAASQEIVIAAQRQIEALSAIRGKIGDRVRAGLSVSSDRNMADVAIQRARADELKARSRFDVSATRLAELIGVRPQRVAELVTADADVRGLGDERGNIEQTPSVLAAGAAVEAASAHVTQAEAERFPAISVGVSRSVSTGPTNANDDTWVGVQIAGDFSLGGLNRHRIAAAKAEQRAALDSLDNERLQARTALNAAATEAAGAWARKASFEEVIGLLRASRDLYWQEYMLNKRTLTDVINPEREIFIAEQERVTAIADSMLARIRAHVAVGRFVELLREQDLASH